MQSTSRAAKGDSYTQPVISAATAGGLMLQDPGGTDAKGRPFDWAAELVPAN